VSFLNSHGRVTVGTVNLLLLVTYIVDPLPVAGLQFQEIRIPDDGQVEVKHVALIIFIIFYNYNKLCAD
jgi:hypothetical protein